jgi:hypothetical protein
MFAGILGFKLQGTFAIEGLTSELELSILGGDQVAAVVPGR